VGGGKVYFRKEGNTVVSLQQSIRKKKGSQKAEEEGLLRGEMPGWDCLTREVRGGMLFVSGGRG